MGSDMSKPRKNIKNMQGIYSPTQLNNQQTLMRPNSAINKHLICKEIDLPCPPLPQPQLCPQQCPEQAMYNHHCRRQHQQPMPVPMHVPQQQQPSCPPQVQQQQPMSPQYSSNPRDNCYDQYSPCREDYREVVYHESDNLPPPPHMPPQYQRSNSRSRCYYNDEQLPISNQTRSDRERPERYRTHRPVSRRDDDDYIERYELPKSSSRSHYKPSYQYYDDLETNVKVPPRYRSKSSDKYMDTKEYIEFEDTAFNMRCEKVNDGKSKMQSRSVYFIKDGQGDTYECSEVGNSKNAYRTLYDSRSNLPHKRSLTHIGRSNVDVTDPYGFKTRNESLLTKPGVSGGGQSKASEPVVNVVSHSSDIVYVPMVKTEFIKRESQKIENIGQSTYQSQVNKQQEHQQKALKSDIKKLSNLSKSYISLQNIESTLKEELETHHRNSSGRDKSNDQLTASCESSHYKPILKKSPTNNELLDSDTTTTSSLNIEEKKNLRSKLNAEFQHVRQRRNYFNNVNYKSELVYNTEILNTDPALNVVKH